MLVLLAGEMLSRGGWSRGPAGPLGVASVSQSSLLNAVVDRTMPAYPENLRRAGVGGVVVSRIVLSPEGRVVSVDVVESPDSAIAFAVRHALLSWQFDSTKLVGPTNPTAIEGKVTLYYLPNGEAGSILDSRQVAAAKATPGGF